MKVHVLASGSSGNAVLVEGREGALLLDCGLGPRVLASCLRQVNVQVPTLRGLILSHEHSDHVKGLRKFRERFSVPIWATGGTWNALGGVSEEGAICASGRPFEVSGFTVQPVATVHDAAEPTAFLVEENGVRLGLVTDTGKVTDLLFERLAGCHILLLEANHDLDMLRYGPYPAALKQRIASSHGHLSNEQARQALERLVHPDLQYVVAMHLSQENNAPSLVQRELMRVLAGSSVNLAVASARGGVTLVVGEDNNEG